MDKKYLTLREAGEYVGVAYKTARMKWPIWKEKHGVRVYKLTRKPLFNKADLDRMVQKHLVN